MSSVGAWDSDVGTVFAENGRNFLKSSCTKNACWSCEKCIIFMFFANFSAKKWDQGTGFLTGGVADSCIQVAQESSGAGELQKAGVGGDAGGWPPCGIRTTPTPCRHLDSVVPSLESFCIPSEEKRAFEDAKWKSDSAKEKETEKRMTEAMKIGEDLRKQIDDMKKSYDGEVEQLRKHLEKNRHESAKERSDLQRKLREVRALGLAQYGQKLGFQWNLFSSTKLRIQPYFSRAWGRGEYKILISQNPKKT